jgi:hypothetical protein
MAVRLALALAAGGARCGCGSERDSPTIRNHLLSRGMHPESHDIGKISICRGMQIDFNEQFEKHESSIRIRLDSLSNVIDSNFESAKHRSPRILMEFQM